MRCLFLRREGGETIHLEMYILLRGIGVLASSIRSILFPRRGRLPKKACLNNEVYGLRPAGAAIKTIDSRACLREMQMQARAQCFSGEVAVVNTGIIASLKS